jgi:hypothetical protein
MSDFAKTELNEVHAKLTSIIVSRNDAVVSKFAEPSFLTQKQEYDIINDCLDKIEAIVASM